MEDWKDHPTLWSPFQQFEDEGLEDRKVHLPLPNLMLPACEGFLSNMEPVDRAAGVCV